MIHCDIIFQKQVTLIQRIPSYASWVLDIAQTTRGIQLVVGNTFDSAKRSSDVESQILRFNPALVQVMEFTPRGALSPSLVSFSGGSLGFSEFSSRPYPALTCVDSRESQASSTNLAANRKDDTIRGKTGTDQGIRVHTRN